MNYFGLPHHGRQLTYLRDLLRELIVRDMKLRYKRSILGIAWTLLNPLTQLLVLLFIFNLVLPLNIPHFSSFLFTGLLVWNWFSGSLNYSTVAIVSSLELIRRPGFPVAILPVVTVMSHLIHFLLALPVLLLFLLLDGTQFTSAVLVLPALVILQFVFTLSLAYMLATFHVKFRDTQYLLGVLLNLFFYLTPVFYETKTVPERYQFIYQLNPMAHVIDAYRAVLIDGTLPGNVPTLLVLSIISVGLLVLGYRTFIRASYNFVEEL